MKTNPWKSVAVLAAVVGAASAAPAQAQGKGKIAWRKSFESAMAEAKKSGKPIFMDFYATWCGPCKSLDAMVFTNPKVVQAMRGYVPVKVDGDKRTDIGRKYGITNFPTLVFLDASGRLRKLQVGVPAPDRRYKSEIEAYSAASGELVKMLKAYRKPRPVMAQR